MQNKKVECIPLTENLSVEAICKIFHLRNQMEHKFCAEKFQSLWIVDRHRVRKLTSPKSITLEEDLYNLPNA